MLVNKFRHRNPALPIRQRLLCRLNAKESHFVNPGCDVAELKVFPVSSVHAEAAVLVTRAAD
jgi:hypothetical protein